MNKHLLLLSVALAVTLGGLALAQSAPEGIDLEAIRERAAEHADDAQALSANVRQRAEALTEDAQAIQSQAQANRTAYRSRPFAAGLRSCQPSRDRKCWASAR
jgi:conjugal transfer pilus assembly protein TrbC